MLSVLLVCALTFLSCDSGSDSSDSGGGTAVDVPFLGRWTVAANEVDLTSGPVSVLFGGGATQSWISSNLGANIWGTKMTYDFRPDGTYTATYRGRAVFGVFVSETEVEETGRFGSSERNGDAVLTLRPDRYTGWIYVGHPDTREAIDERSVPARTYEVGLVEDARGDAYLFLFGTCAAFQIEPWCERDDVLQTLGVLYERTP
ncbi:MAG: hypothetical protein AAF809_12045 [Bacteroidota bacterium]